MVHMKSELYDLKGTNDWKDLNNCQLSILYSILNHDAYVPVNKIAIELKISQKVVRINLPLINRWLKPYNAFINSTPKLGVQLICTLKQRHDITKVIEGTNLFKFCFGRENRSLYMLFTLLTSNEPINSHSYQNIFDISPNSIKKDLYLVDKCLNSYGLCLKRHAGIGTYVEGSEICHRQALLGVIRLIFDASDLINIFTWHRIKYANPWEERSLLKKEILTKMNDWSLSESWRIVNEYLETQGVSSAETDKIRLALYLTIIQLRFTSSNEIRLTDEQVELLKTNENFEDTKNLISLAEKKEHTDYTESEVAQLADEMSTMNRVEYWNNSSVSTTVSPVGFYKIAKNVIEEISDRLNHPIVAPGVIIKLGNHLKRVRACKLNNIPIVNPCVREVKDSYPVIFDSVKTFLQTTPDYFGETLSDDELSFITMYLVLAIQLSDSNKGKYIPKVKVVCPSGGITVEMLMFRLNRELPEIEVTGALSIYNLEREGPGDADAIITTVCSSNFKRFDIPFITVSPLLKPEDVKQIKSLLFPEIKM